MIIMIRVFNQDHFSTNGNNRNVQDVAALCADSSICQNGGTCTQSGSTRTCLCADGYTGTYCDISTITCAQAADTKGENWVLDLKDCE